MTSWRLLPYACRTGPENMALDEALLRLAPVPTLRLYGWRPGALSLGYSQKAPEGWDKPIVRRLTGGGAIWHDRELTYSLSGHEDDLSARNQIRILYTRVHEAVVQALESFGIDAFVQREGESRGKDDPFPCFEKPAAGDVLDRASKLKLAGSAQRRLRKRILQHGSILLARDPLNGAGGTGILEVLGREVDPEALAEALVSGLEASFGVTFERGSLTEAEEALAERLLSKYESDAWTLRKADPVE